MPDSLVFRDASTRDIFTALARFAGISIVFDPAFQDSRLTIDLHHTTLQDALASVTQATGTFYQVAAPRTIVVAPDTAAKRREYEQDVVRTFYLSNADLKETVDLLRMVVDARRIAPITATNAITIKDTPERVAAAGRIIEAIDKARPEVVIDTQLLEVDRTHLLEYGLQVASSDSSGNVQAWHLGQRRCGPGDADAQQAAEPVAVGHPAREPAGALLPAAEVGYGHAHAGEPAASDLGRHHGRGEVRRTCPRAGDDLHAHRDRRNPAAADRRRTTTRTSA